MNYKKLFRFITFVLLILLFIWIEFKDISTEELKTSITNVTKEINNKSEIVTPTEGDLVVTFIDVGQADSIILQQNNEVMLIDAGNNEDGDLLVKYFNDKGITKFKYIIGTHAHEDHIGGLDNIIKNFDTEKIMMPKVLSNTKTFEEVLDAAKEKNIKISSPNINDTFDLGKAKVTVLHIDNEAKDLNDTSIVLRVNYGKTSYLFMADASINVEKNILNEDINSDVLKVGHHGSQYSTSIEFLKEVKPKYAIISVGEKNVYDHPKDITLEKLESVNALIYRTDKQGSIETISNGDNIRISYKKTNTNG